LYNIGIGTDALSQYITGTGSIGIGAQVGGGHHDGGVNTFVGFQAGNSLTGNNIVNTLVGGRAAFNPTHLQECTILGSWAGPSSSLSNIIVINDGATFTAAPKMDYNYTTAGFWTAAANFTLSSSTYKYYIGTDPALFVVPNVTRNNWFEGNAGNPAVTGYGNFGTGDVTALAGADPAAFAPRVAPHNPSRTAA
jgi:hypothetical protein